MRVAVGRADLVRLIANLPPERVSGAAVLLGFEAPIVRDETPIEHDEVRPPFVVESEKSIEPPRRVVADAASLPFWRLETMTFANELEPSRVARPQPGRLTEDDLRSPGRSLFATPIAQQLTPWPRLWPVLRSALQTSILGRDPDVPALVRALCRGEIVRRIPRVTRRAWSGRASVWIDRSARLVPFWSDQAHMCRCLRKVCGQSGLKVRLLDARTQARSSARRGDLLAGFRPDPMTPVLVLGDLGVYGSPIDRSTWLRTAHRLHKADVRSTALVPSPPSRWDPTVTRIWAAVSWERGRQRGGVAVTHEPRFWQERAERLLRLAAPAALVQPGLLRAFRLLLPTWQADAATEADVWSHPDVRAADATGFVLDAEAVERWRTQFATDIAEELKTRVSAVIRHWHVGLPKELLRAETLAWHALIPREIAPPGDLADALAFAERLEETERRGEGDPNLTAVVRRYERVLLTAMPSSIYTAVPALKLVWAAAFQGESSVPVPVGIDPITLHAEIGSPPDEARFWSVRQVGSHLVFSRSQNGAWPSHLAGPGSPIAWLVAARPYLWIMRGQEGVRTQCRLDQCLSIPLRPGEDMDLRTDLSEVILRPWRREPWAAGTGRDRFGLWADAEVKGVVQRFRWIPPGRFQMGSPEGEVGRWNSEGPQHTVTWTKGMWLADTPVTQELWKAVMGNNPSRFRSADRPVESVSWTDCWEFLGQLNAIERGLEARFPSEAEWEHACRAGTKTATWLGDLEIRGDNNARNLDPIAWYDGNSGTDFALKEGTDTSAWPKRQHDHPTGGTHPIRRKSPNPLGLYDMLGNVFEWCLDAWGRYAKGDVMDPPASDASDSDRVVRGGSWDSQARYIRASSRYARAAGERYAYLGFRLARGPAPSSEAAIGRRRPILRSGFLR